MLNAESISSDNLNDLDAEMEFHLGQVGLSTTLFEHLSETAVPIPEMGMTGVRDTPKEKGPDDIDVEDYEH